MNNINNLPNMGITSRQTKVFKQNEKQQAEADIQQKDDSNQKQFTNNLPNNAGQDEILHTLDCLSSYGISMLSTSSAKETTAKVSVSKNGALNIGNTQIEADSETKKQLSILMKSKYSVDTENSFVENNIATIKMVYKKANKNSSYTFKINLGDGTAENPAHITELHRVRNDRNEFKYEYPDGVRKLTYYKTFDKQGNVLEYEYKDGKRVKINPLVQDNRNDISTAVIDSEEDIENLNEINEVEEDTSIKIEINTKEIEFPEGFERINQEDGTVIVSGSINDTTRTYKFNKDGALLEIKQGNKTLKFNENSNYTIVNHSDGTFECAKAIKNTSLGNGTKIEYYNAELLATYTDQNYKKGSDYTYRSHTDNSDLPKGSEMKRYVANSRYSEAYKTKANGSKIADVERYTPDADSDCTHITMYKFIDGSPVFDPDTKKQVIESELKININSQPISFLIKDANGKYIVSSENKSDKEIADLIKNCEYEFVYDSQKLTLDKLIKKLQETKDGVSFVKSSQTNTGEKKTEAVTMMRSRTNTYSKLDDLSKKTYEISYGTPVIGAGGFEKDANGAYVMNDVVATNVKIGSEGVTLPNGQILSWSEWNTTQKLGNYNPLNETGIEPSSSKINTMSVLHGKNDNQIKVKKHTQYNSTFKYTNIDGQLTNYFYQDYVDVVKTIDIANPDNTITSEPSYSGKCFTYDWNGTSGGKEMISWNRERVKFTQNPEKNIDLTAGEWAGWTAEANYISGGINLVKLDEENGTYTVCNFDWNGKLVSTSVYDKSTDTTTVTKAGETYTKVIGAFDFSSSCINSSDANKLNEYYNSLKDENLKTKLTTLSGGLDTTYSKQSVGHEYFWSTINAFVNNPNIKAKIEDLIKYDVENNRFEVHLFDEKGEPYYVNAEELDGTNGSVWMEALEKAAVKFTQRFYGEDIKIEEFHDKAVVHLLDYYWTPVDIARMFFGENFDYSFDVAHTGYYGELDKDALIQTFKEGKSAITLFCTAKSSVGYFSGSVPNADVFNEAATIECGYDVLAYAVKDVDEEGVTLMNPRDPNHPFKISYEYIQNLLKVKQEIITFK